MKTELFMVITGLMCAAGSTAAQAQASGETLFKQRCTMCHTVQKGGKNGIGPNLSSLPRRKAGAVPGFAYSPALKNSPVVWDKAILDRFLVAPNKVVPGTRMVVSVPDNVQRAAIVQYLFGLK